MPIYAYQCQDCKHELEAIQTLSEEPLLECPACHKSKLKKQISAPSFQFKGGGWYKDLYSSPKSDTASEAPKSTSTTTSVASTDDKAAAKPSKTDKATPAKD